jgi:glycosyltransferase involved in cell wall biosynthesis
MCAVTVEPRNNPLVSVGIPTYNRPDGLRRTLECITGQTYKNLEIIVSDNCSPGPETEIIAREFMAKDPRIQYYRQETNKGPLFNFLFVLEKATSEYFLWAADDDMWEKEFIEYVVKPLQNDPKCVISFSPFVYINTHGDKISVPLTFDYSSYHRVIRLMKLSFYHNDICYYGIFRTEIIKKTEIPTWRGINAKSPINTAYPVLCYLLSSGNFAIGGTSPLYYKRLNTEAGREDEHYVPFVTERKNPLFAYFAFIFLKLNAVYECERSIWKGSQSKLTVIFCVFPLMAEALYDCLNIPPKINYFFRRKRPVKITRRMVIFHWYT